MARRLILASRSPRRYELLKAVGLHVDIVPSGITEEIIPGESPPEHVIRLAAAKAQEVGTRYPDQWVVAADTIVCVGDSFLGKPKDRDEAVGMLGLLSGKEHRVLTGFSIRHLGKGVGDEGVVETEVNIKLLASGEMEWYVQTGEPFDKAGGYAIQGIGSFMVESIRGSYTNVVGLPLCEVLQMLKGLGAVTISEYGFRIAP